MSPAPALSKALIAGGGVAGLEGALALREKIAARYLAPYAKRLES